MDNQDTNCIFIENTVRTHVKNISSKSSFFDSPIKCKVVDDCVIFERTTPMFEGKTIKPKKDKSGWWRFQIIGDGIPNGKLDFEDESNEDSVIVYYR